MAGPYLTSPLNEINKAYQQGKAYAFQDAAGKALTSQGADRQAALDDATRIDPEASLSLQGAIQQQALNQQKTQASLNQLQRDQLVNKARFLLAAPPNQRQAIYGGMLESLRGMGIQAPDTVDDNVLQTAQALVSSAQAPKGVVLQAGGKLVDANTGRQLAEGNPAASLGSVELGTPEGGKQRFLYNKKDPTGRLMLPGQGGTVGGGVPATGGYSITTQPAGAAQEAPDLAGRVNALVDGGMEPDAAMQQAFTEAGNPSAFRVRQNPQTGRFENVPVATGVENGAAAAENAPPPAAPAGAGGVSGMPSTAARLGYTPPKAKEPPKPPSGYRYMADGQTLEPIPGGPADTKSNSEMTDGAIENAAWGQILNGDSGIKGYGKEAARLRTQVQNRVADIARAANVSPQELVTTAGRNKALQQSMNALQKQSDALDRNEETFLNNSKVMLDIATQLDNGGVAAWNKFKNDVKANVLGDPLVAQWKAATNIVAQEYAKIASGATGAGGTTEGAREHAYQVINDGYGPGAMKGVIDVLDRDIQGQKVATREKLSAINEARQQLGKSATPPAGSGGSGASGPARPTSQADFDALPAGALFINPKDGKLMRKN